ncbi:MAG: alpha/beta hydrolase [Dermatophilaceae bacterium]|nr:alpha/beta hydrolase [Dermatophilaceae bacterium]
MSTPLDPTGLSITVGDVRLTTPGLRGLADVHSPASPGSRAADDAGQGLLEGLALGGMEESVTIEISDTAEVDGGGGTRGFADESAMILDVPTPGESYGQVVLYKSEDGAFSWHLPESTHAGATRGAAHLRYRIPRAVPEVDPSQSATASRRLLGAIGNKVLKVLVFPLLDPIVGAVTAHFVARWEAIHRRPRVRALTSGTLGDDTVDDLSADGWQLLDGRRILLLIHGTFSRTPGGFGVFWSALDTLAPHYDAILAFDHPSVSVSPSANIAWLASSLPRGIRVEADVITHSRGGLVGRALAERGDDLGIGGRLTVRRLVMVAPPNAGTALADVNRIGGYLDRMTTLFLAFPGPGIADTLATIVSVVKQIAVAGASALDGLAAMDPSGTPLAEFNTGDRRTDGYRIVTADFEPTPGSPFFSLARDAGTDLVFGQAANDLVVPTLGAYDVPGSVGFPLAERLVLARSIGVSHSDYFGRPEVADAIIGWLTETAPANP